MVAEGGVFEVLCLDDFEEGAVVGDSWFIGVWLIVWGGFEGLEEFSGDDEGPSARLTS